MLIDVRPVLQVRATGVWAQGYGCGYRHAFEECPTNSAGQRLFEKA